jgi:glycosyltransferase involved in cell wall biosynthesis
VRVAVITQSRDRVGGVETYIEAVLPALAERYELAFWSASNEITQRGAIQLPGTVLCGKISPTGDPVLSLKAWKPDLLFAHGLDDAVLEAQVLSLAPAVVVEHTYRGTCISSAKTMSWPTVRQCERPFGVACVGLYFPRRCGGLNPLTMVRLYREQSVRLFLLRQAAAVVTLSQHMANEMLRNGLSRERVHVVPPFVVPSSSPSGTATESTNHCRLLFLGRLEPLKGVKRLLRALPLVAAGLGRQVHLVVAGDGAARASLEIVAARICAADARIRVEFVGWQDETGRARLLASADALVVPSLWPEPFGLVGLEAAAAGVPAAAFATGGIPEWLRDGETGCLAPAAGSRPRLLADAIVRCVGSPDVLARLRAGARRAASAWTMERHLRGLDGVFRGVVAAHAVAAR